MLPRGVPSKADAKVLLLYNTTKFLKGKMKEKCKIFRFVDKNTLIEVERELKYRVNSHFSHAYYNK